MRPHLQYGQLDTRSGGRMYLIDMLLPCLPVRTKTISFSSVTDKFILTAHISYLHKI